MDAKQEWFADNQANWDDRANTHMSGNYYGELLADLLVNELALKAGVDVEWGHNNVHDRW
ncbi:hypothetical protein EBF03_07430 [Arcanobacterium haemolyticum]|uniref:hypothetical protein n=1 Tax=Arcanobacterium haemolyticum TaxID=28264 RepID=UPI0002D2785B|nr:hypothetical protein [Arcanobacterium haemolyticum]QCX47257.1 hypothetical protein EBF03_07430 [Arcanobacterium haemolyticum]SQH28028.1 Uncharacterised protein [Arcanobacterium haemolyticum]